MNPLQSRSIELNSSTRDRWAEFASHREHVLALLTAERSTSDATLCILGAGNCNDLDLAGLLSAFRSVQLVDLDAKAIAAGIERQTPPDCQRLVERGGVDVTGAYARIAEWTPQTTLSQDDSQRLVAAAEAVAANWSDGPFDVVASTCLLSQLVGALVQSVGERHPRFVELVQAIRLGHLRLCSAFTNPGGRVLLISDLVSSDTCPELPTIDERDLPPLVDRLLGQRNFFTGVNPISVLGTLRDDPVLKSQLANVRLRAPWKWNLGARTYVIYAIEATRQ